MKVAIVGSRSITGVNMQKYVSDGDEIVSGGAKGGIFVRLNMRGKMV